MMVKNKTDNMRLLKYLIAYTLIVIFLSFTTTSGPLAQWSPYGSSYGFPYVTAPAPDPSGYIWASPTMGYNPLMNAGISVNYLPGTQWSSPYFQQNNYNPYNLNMPYTFGWNQPYSSYGWNTPWISQGNPWNSPFGTFWNNSFLSSWSSNQWQPYQNYMGGPQSYTPPGSPLFPGYGMPDYGWNSMLPPYISYPSYPYPTYPQYEWWYPRNAAYTDGISGKISNESLDDEEYLVYSALIEEKFHASTILILEHTYIGSMVRDPVYESLKDTFNDLERSAVEDYLDKNDQWYYLDDHFDLADYELVELEPDMYNVVRLSRVGFSSDGNQSFVYAERAEAALAGAGYYFFLVKEDGVWEVEDQFQLWIS